MTSDLKCLRCRYTWKRRTWNRLPRQCPNCHRNDWNKVEVGPVGRPPIKVEAKVLTSEDALKIIKRAIGHLSADDEAISVLVESCYLIEREATLCKHYSSGKAKEVMPSDSIQQTNGDVSGEHRAEMMSTSAKPVENEPMESVMRSETHPGNCECGLCSPDHRNVLIGPIGQIGPQFKHKAYGVTSQNMVPHVLTESELPSQDRSTDDLLNHLLEQLEGEDT